MVVSTSMKMGEALKVFRLKDIYIILAINESNEALQELKLKQAVICE